MSFMLNLLKKILVVAVYFESFLYFIIFFITVTLKILFDLSTWTISIFLPGAGAGCMHFMPAVTPTKTP